MTFLRLGAGLGVFLIFEGMFVGSWFCGFVRFVWRGLLRA